jgi:formate C-acetyltransferase
MADAALTQDGQLGRQREYEKVDNEGVPYRELINASPRITQLRNQFFDYKPSLCVERARIVSQYYTRPESHSKPLIIQRAQAFRAVLNKLSINIHADELLVGSLGSRPRSYPIIPEMVGDFLIGELDDIASRQYDTFAISETDKKELIEDILPFWKGKSSLSRLIEVLAPFEKQLLFHGPTEEQKGTGIITANATTPGSGGHVTLDYPKLLRCGFQGIKEEARVCLEGLDHMNPEDVDKIDFYRAVIECCEGMSEFGFRFSHMAKEMADKTADPVRRAELEEISRVCAQVPAYPARSFYEAVQSIWLAQIGILQEDYNKCCPLGRIDSYLYPFYSQDLANGSLTEAVAQDLLDNLWLKLAETNLLHWGPYTKLVAGFPSQQQIPVGGQTPNGKDATNPLTYQCIQATVNTRLPQPSLTVRLHEDSPDELYRKAAELLRMGTGHPSFFNDEAVVPALVKDGIALEHARDYSSVGCVGAQVSGCGKGSQNGGYLNAASALEFALTNGYWRHGDKVISIQTGDPGEFASFDEMWAAFEAQFRHIIKTLLGVSLKAERLHKFHNQTPYLSSLVEGCIQSGLDKSEGGGIYNTGMSFRATGLADVVDSLLAIKKFIYDDQTVSMEQMLQALEDNFEGHEILHQILLTRTPRYGRGDQAADDMARKVLEVMADECDRHRSYYGGRFQVGFGSVSAHMPFGMVLGAFPDGRKAGESLTDGIGPVHRQTQDGPTTVMRSVGTMPHEKLSGGSILNLKFPPDVVKGEEGLESLMGLLKGFVSCGAWHCQFNVFDAQTMREAQKMPSQYQDLLVRVAGYSAFFTGLPTELQDNIIDRTVHGLK